MEELNESPESLAKRVSIFFHRIRSSFRAPSQSAKNKNNVLSAMESYPFKIQENVQVTTKLGGKQKSYFLP